MAAKAKRGRPRGIEALAKKAAERFKAIKRPAAVSSDKTAAAQQRLEAAVSSVDNVLLNLEVARAVDKDFKQRDLRGRLSETHVDLLRTAIVFAGAGLDATLKELIRSTIRDVWTRSDQARDKFKEFVRTHLAPGAQQVSVGALADLLVAPKGTQDELLRLYERNLTGGSLQSAQQVGVVCSALGVQTKERGQRQKDGGVLDLMFRARNEIIHELDLIPEGRRSRRIETVREFATEALSVTQDILNAVAAALTAPPIKAPGKKAAKAKKKAKDVPPPVPAAP